VGFSVLFVCTGNICRSPVAERLFRAGLRRDAVVLVASAGTSGLAGHPIDAPMAALLRAAGVDPDGHRARPIDQVLLDQADLVLTASVSQRRTLLVAGPSMLHRIFTLREFARLAVVAEPASGIWPASDPLDGAAPGPEQLRDRVAMIGRGRGVSGPVRAGDDDIPDPFGASSKIAEATFAAIASAVDSVLAGLSLDR
jgi:protein-tyrosine phosphatase